MLLAETMEGRIDMVLMEVVMPHTSGREVASRLEVLRLGLKVLYMSGQKDGAIVQQGVLDPGIAFIQEPVARHALVEKVRKVLTGEEWSVDSRRGR